MKKKERYQIIISLIILAGFGALYYWGSNLREEFRKAICEGDYENLYVKKVEIIDHHQSKSSDEFEYDLAFNGNYYGSFIYRDERAKNHGLKVGDSVYILFNKNHTRESVWVKDHPCDTLHWDSVQFLK